MLKVLIRPTGRGGAVTRAVLAAAGAVMLSSCKPQGGPPPAMTPEVAFIAVQPEPVTLTTELPGRTSAFLVADIRPQVNGIIEKRLFEEGAEVDAGQVLYQIDPATYEAALGSAEAALARAEAAAQAVKLRAERYGQLIEEKAISRQDYDDALAGVQQANAEVMYARAAVQTARIHLDYTKVTAPIGGRIGRSSVTDGALVTAFQPMALATIQQLDPMYVDVPQPTAERIRKPDGPGREVVKLILADGRPYPLEGQLQFQDVSVDPSTGTVNLRAVFPNPDRVLLPGMFVRAIITDEADAQAILVPQTCVQRTPKGDAYVLVVNAEERVQIQPVVIDRTVGNQWRVTSGLQPGDRVVVGGLQRPRPGVPVKAAPLNGPPAADAPAGTPTGPTAPPAQK
ncbi:MAG: efflux RND transporter periplasmic adaptor subunit [Kiritimatiellae bacterium]|nr:efflux RND transporter periplasmic adaptor subunit [Kiritimatiellia bacterium]